MFSWLLMPLNALADLGQRKALKLAWFQMYSSLTAAPV